MQYTSTVASMAHPSTMCDVWQNIENPTIQPVACSQPAAYCMSVCQEFLARMDIGRKILIRECWGSSIPSTCGARCGRGCSWKDQAGGRSVAGRTSVTNSGQYRWLDLARRDQQRHLPLPIQVDNCL